MAKLGSVAAARSDGFIRCSTRHHHHQHHHGACSCSHSRRECHPRHAFCYKKHEIKAFLRQHCGIRHQQDIRTQRQEVKVQQWTGWGTARSCFHKHHSHVSSSPPDKWSTILKTNTLVLIPKAVLVVAFITLCRMVTSETEDGAGQHQPNQQQLVRCMEPSCTEPQQHSGIVFFGLGLSSECASGCDGVMRFACGTWALSWHHVDMR